MSKKTISVKAGEGLKVYFPNRTIAAPGGRTFILAGDNVAEVDPEDRFVARRILVGDLVMVKQTRAPKAKAKPAEEIKNPEAK